MLRMGRWTVALAIVMASGSAWAHEGHHDEAAEQAAAAGSSGQTMTGEVVDVVCYLSHGEKGLGASHAGCGKKCIKSGLPVALKVGDQLYLAAMADHTPANAALADYTGQRVTVHGTVTERDGQHLVSIATVEKAH